MTPVRAASIGTAAICVLYGTFLLWHGPHRRWLARIMGRVHAALFHRVSWLYPIGRGTPWSEEQIHRAYAYILAIVLILIGFTIFRLGVSV